MKIVLSPKNYNWMASVIDAIRRGNMCKIMKIENAATKEIWYEICDDVSAGWTTETGRAFHPVMIDDDKRMTGLGTFYYVSDTKTGTGDYILEFTDDLNPDMP